MDWKELEKMTVVKLREEALKHTQISGVRGKTKAQLMDELAVVLGIEKPQHHFTEKVVHTKESLKKAIRDLKHKRDELIRARDHKALHDVRREMHRLKHTIRKIEAAKDAEER